MAGFLACLVLAAATAWVAERKNRNTLVWAALGFLFGVVALAVCAVYPRQSTDAWF
jgi:hypothetical protein